MTKRKILLASTCLLLGFLLMGQYAYAAAPNNPDICPTDCYQYTFTVNSYEVTGNPSGDLGAQFNLGTTPYTVGPHWVTDGYSVSFAVNPSCIRHCSIQGQTLDFDGYAYSSGLAVTATSPSGCEIAQGSYPHECTSATFKISSGGSYSVYMEYCNPSSSDCPKFYFGVTPTGDYAYPVNFMNNITQSYKLAAGEQEGCYGQNTGGSTTPCPNGQIFVTDSDLHSADFNMAEYIINLGQPSSTDITTAVSNFPDVHLWQVMNEPNCLSGSNCLSASTAASDTKTWYSEIHTADSQAVVLAPAITCFHTNGNKMVYLDSTCITWAKDYMSDLGSGTYFDAIAIHVYSAPAQISSNTTAQNIITNGIAELYSILGNKTMYITEFGFQSATAGQSAQAANLVTLLNIFTNESYIQGAYWYRMSDKGQSSHTWGLFSSDNTNTYKQAATAYLDYVTRYY